MIKPFLPVRRLIARLTRPRTAIILLAATLAAAMAGLGGGADVFSSPPFLALCLASLLSLASNLPATAKGLARAAGRKKIRAAARRCGALLLHAGLLGVITTGAAGYLTHSRGFVQLMTGERLGGSPEWLEEERGPLAASLRPGFTTRLERVEMEFWPDNSVRRLASHIIIKPSDGPERSITTSLGQPAVFKDVTIMQTSHFGYVATFVFKPAGGPGIPVHYLFDRAAVPGAAVHRQDSFPLTPYRLDIRLRPNAAAASPALERPVTEVTVTANRQRLFSGQLAPGDHADIDGGRLYCYSIDYWSGVSMIKGYHSGWLYASFALIALGAVLLSAATAPHGPGNNRGHT